MQAASAAPSAAAETAPTNSLSFAGAAFAVRTTDPMVTVSLRVRAPPRAAVSDWRSPGSRPPASVLPVNENVPAVVTTLRSSSVLPYVPARSAVMMTVPELGEAEKSVRANG